MPINDEEKCNIFLTEIIMSEGISKWFIVNIEKKFRIYHKNKQLISNTLVFISNSQLYGFFRDG